ncbi:MAG: hypothetical protein AB7O24_23210 [Kofleriaceae bacterium]
MRYLGLLLGVGCVVGCSYRERARVVRPTDVGTVTATITNYMSAPRRFGSPSEDTPSGISREAIVDEATLMSLTPQGVCVGLTMRTAVDLDMPLSDWNFSLNGQTVYPSNELVTVRDRHYQGEQDVVVADAVTPSMLASLRITQPTNAVFRVFSRSAQLCTNAPLGERVVHLEVERPMDDRRGGWGAQFEWTVQ